jgi:hypothetical protein
MRNGVCSVAILGVLLSACGTSPQKPGPVASAAPPPALMQKPGVPYDPRLAAGDKRARELGYHVETRHGEQFYCRMHAPLGSRLEQKECLTAEGMAQAAQISEENKVNQRQNQLCQGANCVVN